MICSKPQPPSKGLLSEKNQELGEPSKEKYFFWEFFPKYGWSDSQTRSKPLKTPQVTLKIAFFNLNFTFCSTKSHKNPGVGKHIWERSPKKNTFFLDAFPKTIYRMISKQFRRRWKLNLGLSHCRNCCHHCCRQHRQQRQREQQQQQQ